MPANVEGVLSFADDGGVLAAGVAPAKGQPKGSEMILFRVPDLVALRRWKNDRSHQGKGWSGFVSVSAGRNCVAAGSQDDTTKLFRAIGDEEPRTWPNPGGPVTSVALSRDETLVVSERMTLPAPGEVRAIRFSPDGNKLAVLVKNETAVRIWHLDRLRARLAALNLGW